MKQKNGLYEVNLLTNQPIKQISTISADIRSKIYVLVTKDCKIIWFCWYFGVILKSFYKSGILQANYYLINEIIYLSMF